KWKFEDNTNSPAPTLTRMSEDEDPLMTIYKSAPSRIPSHTSKQWEESEDDGGSGSKNLIVPLPSSQRESPRPNKWNTQRDLGLKKYTSAAPKSKLATMLIRVAPESYPNEEEEDEISSESDGDDVNTYEGKNEMEKEQEKEEKPREDHQSKDKESMKWGRQDIYDDDTPSCSRHYTSQREERNGDAVPQSKATPFA
ncbi:hypothetical protein PMAYCL1PPCAC_28860, partial [Pristionchus mayeri]